MKKLILPFVVVAGLFSFSFGQSTGVACTMDAMQCSDGSWVGRTGPDCQFVCPNVSTGSKDDNQIINALDNLTGEVKQLNESIKFQNFQSCSNMEQVLENFISKSWKNNYWYRGRVGIMEDVAVDSLMGSQSAGSAVSNEVMLESKSVQSSTTDYSTTNLQVGGVDEPEILKTDGKYVYYYNSQQKKIFVIKSPLDISTSQINLENADIVKTISIPSSFEGAQIFVKDNKLVIISNSYNYVVSQTSLIDRSSKTMVVIYDISDINNLKLLKLDAVDGNFFDARLTDNKLYIISRAYVNWGPVYPLMSREAQSVNIDIKGKDIIPSQIDVSYTENTKNQDLIMKGKKYPYDVNAGSINCQDISYILPSEDSLDKFDFQPHFAIINQINLSDLESKPLTKVMFGSVEQMHMSQDSIYIANNFYTSYNFRCPAGRLCIMPYYRGGENTLVHKFSLTTGINYVNSNIMEGVPLNQYSMSEDDAGYFRILTKTWYPELATHLNILDSGLNSYGILRNIEPKEEFKGSRFIGDKLYLVTFKQIDPLFVIDLSNRKIPKILGELKIPGYSTYLHPYSSMTGGIQYLIGLGYDTGTGAWGGTVNSGIKIDLYKVDYNSISTSGLDIKQLYSTTVGGQGSWTEATENPRMFVWDSSRKMLIMPLISQIQEETNNCNINYDKSGKEISKNCYPGSVYNTTFAGIKGFNIDTAKGITEIFSQDYSSILTGNEYSYGKGIDQWAFRAMNFRVGYLGDVIYNLNNSFGEFSILGNDQRKKLDF